MDESTRKRKGLCSGLSRSRRISAPFVSPLLSRRETQENQGKHSEPDDPVCKRIKFDNLTSIQHEIDAKTDSSQTSASSQDKIGTPESSGELSLLPSTPPSNEVKEIQLLLQKKQETLRKLNMVKMYRKKNNLDELQVLINKWRKVSQEAANRLFESITTVKHTVNMGQLLNQLQISHELIGYSEDEEGFLSS